MGQAGLPNGFPALVKMGYSVVFDVPGPVVLIIAIIFASSFVKAAGLIAVALSGVWN